MSFSVKSLSFRNMSQAKARLIHKERLSVCSFLFLGSKYYLRFHDNFKLASLLVPLKIKMKLRGLCV